ncbi:hypothetical protein L0F63_000276 [Massospora cicadina]|nr:hypothetical protein L0F63_000276 [Massospora cicadina]
MVQDFNLTGDDRLIGYYAGLVSASFAAGEFFGGISWGKLSDRVGRKPIVLMGLLGTAISMFLFGMSKSMPWAMVTRFMAGCLNGNIGVLKTMVGEMTDRTNRAEAFGYAAMMFGIGLIIGPAMGGFLTKPAENYPWLFGNIQFLKDYPYFLPCGLSSLFCAIGFVFAYIYLDETLERQEQVATPAQPLESNSATPLLGSSSEGPSTGSTYGTFSLDKNLPATVEAGGVSNTPVEEHEQISRGTRLIVLSYMGLSLLLAMSDELFPFWASTKVEGGGWDTPLAILGC